MNIRFYLYTLLLFCIVFCGVSCGSEDDPVPDGNTTQEPDVPEEPETPKEYQLVWEDEFEGSELDLTKWNYELGGRGWGNQEKQYYTDRPENLRVENGNLVIQALKENYQDHAYTSARITTKGKVAVKYGKIEARICIPPGRGTWSAFWMMPQNSEYGGWPRSGELDIMEHVGSDPRMISHAVHTQNRSGGNSWSFRKYLDNVESNYHVYSIEWLENADDGDDCITFYIDGEKSTTKWQAFDDYKDWPFDKEFYVILNLALGGTWGGTIDDSIFDSPVEMMVDYVRIYQKR